MFNKRCSKCNKKVAKDFEYCPFCANPLKNPKEYGLLGKSDNLNELDEMLKHSFSSSLGSSFFEKIIAGTMKRLEKEIRSMNLEEELKKPNQSSKSNFQLYINGKRVPISHEMPISIEKKQLKTNPPKISDDTVQKSLNLPRKEAKSKLTRLKDKVIYQLHTPGLNKIENVIVNKLENSIEIKAFTDKAVFYKTLPIKLQLAQYSIKDDNLFLEFKA